MNRTLFLAAAALFVAAQKPALEKGGLFWTQILVLGPGAGFELSVPPALLSGAARTLELGWIDFYRR
jgi:hypothetical protein